MYKGKRLNKVVNIGTVPQFYVQTPGELNSRGYNHRLSDVAQCKHKQHAYNKVL